MAKKARGKRDGARALSAAQVKATITKFNKGKKSRKAKNKKALDLLLVKIKTAESKLDRILDEIYDALSEVKATFHKTRIKVLESEGPKGDIGRP